MAHPRLPRLHRAETDLYQWYRDYYRPAGRQRTADLKAMRRGYLEQNNREMVALVDQEFARRKAESHARLAELKADVALAAATVKAAAVRKRTPATEAAKSDIRAILQGGGAPASFVAQWIAETKPNSPEYWTAFEEVVSQMKVAEGPRPSQYVTDLVHQLPAAIASQERHTYTAEERTRARDAQEVDAFLNFVNANIKEAEAFLDREQPSSDAPLPRGGIRRWLGLPDTEHPNGVLYTGSTRIPLVDEKTGAFLDAEPMEV